MSTKPKTTSKRTTYFIANCTAGNIVIPQAPVPGQKIIASGKLSPIIIPPGMSISMSADKWNELKKNAGIKNYMDHGLLKETRKEGEVAIMAEETSHPVVPENLLREEEVAANVKAPSAAPIRASVRRKTAQIIQVE